MVLLVQYAIWELGSQWFCISLCTSHYEMLQGNLFLFLLVTLYRGQPMVSVYNYTYTTFTPHFKGKRRCISGIIALLSVLRNALKREVVYTSYIPQGYNMYRRDVTCIYYLLFSLMYSKHSQKLSVKLCDLLCFNIVTLHRIDSGF